MVCISGSPYFSGLPDFYFSSALIFQAFEPVENYLVAFHIDSDKKRNQAVRDQRIQQSLAIPLSGQFFHCPRVPHPQRALTGCHEDHASSSTALAYRIPSEPAPVIMQIMSVLTLLSRTTSAEADIFLSALSPFFPQIIHNRRGNDGMKP